MGDRPVWTPLPEEAKELNRSDKKRLQFYVKDENAFQRLSLFLDRPFITMRLPHKNKTIETRLD